MGHHYVPQHYLRGFETLAYPGSIWRYDKASKLFKRIPIKVVAQEPAFYDEETERALSTQIEQPALGSLARLRRREPINQDDRARLAVYTASMMMRVPRRRRRSLEMVPSVLTDTIAGFRKRLEGWASSPDADQVLVAHRFAELEAAHEKFVREPPLAVIDQVRSPWPRQRFVDLIFAMTWRVIVVDASTRFLTSDNPAFFFEAYGLGQPEAEISFPLASDVALHGSWQGPREGLVFVQAKPALVREINRRVTSGAERFVFFHKHANWIAAVTEKLHPFLSRILW